MERELSLPTKQEQLVAIRTAHPELENVHPKFLVAQEETEDQFELESPTENERPLRALARIGIENFTDMDKVPTPLTAEGLVDVPALIQLVKDVVGEREWEAPFFDVHHLYWPCASYEDIGDTENFLDSMEYSTDELDDLEVRKRFRELEQNKIGVPRIFHDVVHAITLPPPMPSLDLMRREIRKEKCNQHLFTVANRVVQIQESQGRIKPIHNKNGDLIGFHDAKERRTYDSQGKLRQIERRKQAFIRQILKSYKNGVIDLSDIAPLEYVDRKTLEERMKDIVEVLDDGMIKIHNKRVLQVDIPIRHVAKTTYMRGAEPPKAA